MAAGILPASQNCGQRRGRARRRDSSRRRSDETTVVPLLRRRDAWFNRRSRTWNRLHFSTGKPASFLPRKPPSMLMTFAYPIFLQAVCRESRTEAASGVENHRGVGVGLEETDRCPSRNSVERSLLASIPIELTVHRIVRVATIIRGSATWDRFVPTFRPLFERMPRDEYEAATARKHSEKLSDICMALCF